MSMRYEETARLRRGLDGGVSTLAFSPDGTYLATAGMQDARVYIWRVKDSMLLHTYAGGDRPVLSLEWLPGRTDTVLCGSNNGYISELRFDAVRLDSPYAFCAHASHRFGSIYPRLLGFGHMTIQWNALQHKVIG